VADEHDLTPTDTDAPPRVPAPRSAPTGSGPDTAAPLEPGPIGPPPVESLPRAWKIGSILVGSGLVVWFFFAWLALDKHIFDAAGESLGSAFAVLVIVSIIGSIRRNHD
jgi:hypothetical protein